MKARETREHERRSLQKLGHSLQEFGAIRAMERPFKTRMCPTREAWTHESWECPDAHHPMELRFPAETPERRIEWIKKSLAACQQLQDASSLFRVAPSRCVSAHFSLEAVYKLFGAGRCVVLVCFMEGVETQLATCAGSLCHGMMWRGWTCNWPGQTEGDSFADSADSQAGVEPVMRIYTYLAMKRQVNEWIVFQCGFTGGTPARSSLSSSA